MKLTTPAVVEVPIPLKSVVNQRLLSAPTMISIASAGAPILSGYSVTPQLLVTAPILPPLNSVNHMRLSGPSTIPKGLAPDVFSVGQVLVTPAVVECTIALAESFPYHKKPLPEPILISLVLLAGPWKIHISAPFCVEQAGTICGLAPMTAAATSGTS